MANDVQNPTVQSKESTNVTLVVDDETQIPAHQIVLPNSNPIVKGTEQDKEKTSLVINVKSPSQMRIKLKFSI